MRAWVIGRGKHFKRNIGRISEETPTINASGVSYLQIPEKKPTQVTHKELRGVNTTPITFCQ